MSAIVVRAPSQSVNDQYLIVTHDQEYRLDGVFMVFEE
jgi:hypothetical protein